MPIATPTLAVAVVGMAVAAWAAACGAEPALEPSAEDQIFGAAEPTAEEPATAEDGGVFLPADRTKERQLDRARRLVNSGNWTDAAALLDEILADDRDAFVQGDGTAITRRSIRDSAARMIESLPDPGRQAYALMVHGRAERALAEAVARDDAAGIVAVARRWFATPAGHQAALLVAFAALEADDPLAATAWLGRVAASADAGRAEPTLTVMRAVASERAGDSTAARELLRIARARGEATARIGGRDVPLSGESGGDAAWLERIAAVRADGRGRGAGEWRQPRGDVARNALADATRPLLVPRYRVPLTRHPEESRLLERHRRAAAAEGDLVMPAGGPLAVRGIVVLHTALGILGIDFETGKRLWLRSGVSAGASAAATGDAWLQAALGRVFDDATSGGLSSDGTLVFAVESHADALTPPSGHRRVAPRLR